MFRLIQELTSPQQLYPTSGLQRTRSLRAVVGGMGGGGGRSRRVLETEVANGPLVA